MLSIAQPPRHHRPRHPGRPFRRALSTTALCLAVGAGTLAGAGVADAAPRDSLVGTWTATVDREGVTNSATFGFRRDGSLCLRTEGSSGTGTWRQAGDGTLNYRAREALRDPATGASAGVVRINQTGRQQGDRFSSSGISLVYDTEGRLTDTVRSTVRATRTSTDPAC